MKCLVLAITTIAIVLSGCGSSGAVPTPDQPPVLTPTRAAAAYLTPAPEIQPVRFPDDEAPHDVLTEWWYYTGHLFTPDGERYGFEYVFFQGQRGVFPTVYAAHFAITDNRSGQFVYDQKIGQDASLGATVGFHLKLDGWEMSGALGKDRLIAAMDGYSIDLVLEGTKDPALHNRIGYVDFGPSGGSYYYSRTRMEITGSISVGGRQFDVFGEAWMDHQWGNFISVGGGWDWFAVQLDTKEELTISVVRDLDRKVVMSYGTLAGEDGSTVHLKATDIAVTATGEWTSPHSGVTYPSGWQISVPSYSLSLTLAPTRNDQELDTTLSTGVIYWEGEVLVTGEVSGAPVTGLGYVELTGYGAVSARS